MMKNDQLLKYLEQLTTKYTNVTKIIFLRIIFY